MNIFQKRLSFGLYPMFALWCLLFVAFLFLFGGVSINVMHVLFDRQLFGPGYLSIVHWPLMFYSICLLLWSKNIFRRGDLIRLAKKEGVKLLKGVPYIIVLLTMWARSIVRGRLNEHIYIIAKLQGAFWLPMGFGYFTGLSAEVLDKTDRVGFAFLASSPVNSDVEIHIDGQKRQLPQTGMQEIDEILRDSLEGVNDFRATLALRREYICLTIIGGVWFGKRFQERIIKGFEIAKKMNVALKKEYEYKDWSGYDMKWDFEKTTFVLVEKLERYAIFS